MEKEKFTCSGGRNIGSNTFVLTALLLFFILFIAAGPASGKSELSLTYPGPGVRADLETGPLSFGLFRSREGDYGFGLAPGQWGSFSWKGFELKPFLVGGKFFSTGSLSLTDFTGGLESSYFDYRIGGWAFSSESRLWFDTRSFSLSSYGAYTLGNLNLEFDIVFGTDPDAGNRWYPAREKGYWKALFRRDFGYFNPAYRRYFFLGGERRFSLGGVKFKWSQGINLDSRGDGVTLGVMGQLSHEGSKFAFLVEESVIRSWRLVLSGANLDIGFVGATQSGSGYGLSLTYRGERKLTVELLQEKDLAATRINMSLRW